MVGWKTIAFISVVQFLQLTKNPFNHFLGQLCNILKSKQDDVKITTHMSGQLISDDVT